MRMRSGCAVVFIRWIRLCGVRVKAAVPAAMGCFLLALATVAQAATFNVNTFVDVPDVNPGDGVCETAAGNNACNLRAAIQETNALAGADTIVLQAGVTYTLGSVGQDDTALSGDLDILDSVTIVGAGPASTIIDGNGAVTSDRVFDIKRCRGNPQQPDCDVSHPPIVVSISGVTIQHGNGPAGGGIVSGGSLTLTNCVVANNAASGLNAWGGGIYSAGALNISNSTISNNTAGPNNPFGGGIYAQGAIAITGSTISGNSTTGSFGSGGGLILYFSPAGSITNSTISGNTAFGNGGGLLMQSGKVVNSTISGNVSHAKGGGAAVTNSTFINSTVSGNFSYDDGGGIYAISGVTQLYHVTVTQNLANADDSGTAVAGGVYNATANAFYSVNSIIALNETSIPDDPFPLLDTDDCAGSITSQGNSILYDVKIAHCTVSGTKSLVNPLLGPLQYNGGATKTHALLDGSTAIDGGPVAVCVDDLGNPLASDQRGVHRPWGAQCDLGAYEAQPDLIFKNGFEP